LLVERVVADLAQAREVDASGGPGPSIPPLMTTVKVVVKGIDHSFQIDDGCTVVHPLATGGLRYIDQSHSEGLRAILVMRGAYRTLVDRKK
jgi:hypothetical protein